MKNGHFILRASIAAALAATPLVSMASASNALAGINTAEMPRVTQTINANVVTTLVHSRPAAFAQATPGAVLDSQMVMNHMQLVLKPSVNRKAQLEALIQQQHTPGSAHFHQWLTPTQFGQTFGVLNSDVVAVTAWLKSQGFTVNGVYPNNQTVDFSGSVGQVNQAFHTQERHFQLNNNDYVANATDISVPTALQPVIIGVVGLHNYSPKPAIGSSRTAAWNPKTHKFNLPPTATSAAVAKAGRLPQALQSDGVRGLVPDDFSTMYGVSTIRKNGVTGAGVTIALVEEGNMSATSWNNFVTQFNLGSYGGTFVEEQPELNGSSFNNCLKPFSTVFGADDDLESAIDTEYATAIAPGANIVDAACYNAWAEYPPAGLPPIPNVYDGMYIAANNLVNSITIGIYGEQYAGPDILSASFGVGEGETTDLDKAEVDALWAQADAEGTSVFVSSGDWGSVTAGIGLDPNSLATSTHVTAVFGTDLADTLDGTTSKYFSATPNASYGTALSYVPEIPWNESCGNGVVATAAGFSGAPAYCDFLLSLDPEGYYVTGTASGGGASRADIKPSWQTLVYDTAQDGVRDIPDVSLFAGSFDGSTVTVVCTKNYPCEPNFTTPVELIEGTSLSSPMFAGIQALIDQGLAMRGLPQDQGNAAPALYAIAAREYGGPTSASPASLASCNADNGATGTGNCVFHNVTRGTISSECFQEAGESLITPNCYFIGTAGIAQIGLTSKEAEPTDYNPESKAYRARPGWSFSSGLGSVNATNLLIAWRALDNAPPAAPPMP